MPQPDAYFRAGVGLLIRNNDRHVLALERIDMRGSWQAPQGGLSAGEQPRQAAERELDEETGVSWDKVDLIDEYPGWLAYELPSDAQSAKTGLGQVQKWFLLEARHSDLDIHLNANGQTAEFADWQWMPFAQLASSVWHVRRPIYDALALRWQHLLA